MASDQDLPGQFEMSIGDESIPRAVQAEIGHMTLEEAIASGFFDLPKTIVVTQPRTFPKAAPRVADVAPHWWDAGLE